MIFTEYTFLIISQVILLASIQITHPKAVMLKMEIKKWVKFKGNLPCIIRFFPLQRRAN